MMTISISNLKAHLSATLKAVSKGEKYTVMDRDYPVAEILPISSKTSLSIRPPLSKKKKILNEFKGIKDFDPVEVLRLDRSGNRF